MPTDNDPFLLDSGTPPPPRTNRRLWLLLLVLVPLGLVGMAGLLVAVGALYVFTSKEMEVAERDRQVVADIQALAKHRPGIEPDLDLETITKSRFVDRSVEIEYEYNSDQEEGQPYLYCTVNLERSVSDAHSTYLVAWGSARLGTWAGGDADSQVIERNDLFRWGDQSRFGIIQAGGKPAGNLFVARKGKSVFLVTLGGVCFEDGPSFSRFVGPALAKLETYRPDKGR